MCKCKGEDKELRPAGNDTMQLCVHGTRITNNDTTTNLVSLYATKSKLSSNMPQHADFHSLLSIQLFEINLRTSLKQNGKANTATPMMLLERLKTNGQLDDIIMSSSSGVTADINNTASNSLQQQA